MSISSRSRFLKTAYLTGLLALASACTHSLHLSHVSDFSPTYTKYTSGRVVKSKAEQFVVLGFADQTNYVDQAFSGLKTKCPSGRIQGITTQYSTSHGFFSWTNYIEMQGLCVE